MIDKLSAGPLLTHKEEEESSSRTQSCDIKTGPQYTKNLKYVSTHWNLINMQMAFFYITSGQVINQPAFNVGFAIELGK